MPRTIVGAGGTGLGFYAGAWLGQQPWLRRPTIQADIFVRPADGFLQTYRQLDPFASTDPTRHVLKSVFVDTTGKGVRPVIIVVCDGRRLAVFSPLLLPVK